MIETKSNFQMLVETQSENLKCFSSNEKIEIIKFIEENLDNDEDCLALMFYVFLVENKLSDLKPLLATYQ